MQKQNVQSILTAIHHSLFCIHSLTRISFSDTFDKEPLMKEKLAPKM